MTRAAWIPGNASSHVSHRSLGKFRSTSPNTCLRDVKSKQKPLKLSGLALRSAESSEEGVDKLFSVRLLDLFTISL